MNIAETLLGYNIWWRNGSFLPVEDSYPKRDIFDSIIRNIKNRYFIEGIIGIRRVGKTTLLRQCIAELLKEKIPGNNILFFSFEEEIVSKNPSALEAVIEFYFREVVKSSVFENNQKVFLFLDEIQYVPYWQSVIKKYYDISHNLKFIVSGSSSLFISDMAKESLTGRIFETVVPPLSFKEFLLLKNRKTFPPRIDIFGFFKKQVPEDVADLLPDFTEYIVEGQFPELINIKTVQEKKQYINNYVLGKVLEYDLPNILKLRYSESLLALGKILIQRSGQIIELQNLASDIEIKRQTLARYLRYLEKSLLFSQILNKGVGFREREKRQRKVYAGSSNFPALARTDGHLSANLGEYIGMIAETYVSYVLENFYPDAQLYFYRERGKEVDFVLQTADVVVPIEVKYQDKIKDNDFKNLLWFMERERISRGFLISKSAFGVRNIHGMEINILPMCLI